MASLNTGDLELGMYIERKTFILINSYIASMKSYIVFEPMSGFSDAMNNVTLNEKYFIEICYIDIINRFSNAMKYSH